MPMEKRESKFRPSKKDYKDQRGYINDYQKWLRLYNQGNEEKFKVNFEALTEEAKKKVDSSCRIQIPKELGVVEKKIDYDKMVRDSKKVRGELDSFKEVYSILDDQEKTLLMKLNRVRKVKELIRSIVKEDYE